MILDGKGISASWQQEVAAEVAEVTARAGRPPGLAVVLVGGRPDSKIYVHRKQEACHKVCACCGITDDFSYSRSLYARVTLTGRHSMGPLLPCRR